MHLPPNLQELQYKRVMTPKVALALLIALVLLLSLVVYIGGHRKTHQAAKGSPLDFTYKNTQEFNITGTGNGGGMSFQRPLPFGQHIGKSLKTTRVPLQHLVLADKKAVPIGGAYSMILNVPTAPPHFFEIFTKAVSSPKVVSDPNDSQHQSVLRVIDDNIQQFIGTDYSLHLDSASAFTNSDIKGKAWKFDFSAQAKDPAKNGQKPDKLNGTEIFAVSKNNFYYFTLYSTDKNWQSNKDFWPKVIDSLKIDQ